MKGKTVSSSFFGEGMASDFSPIFCKTAEAQQQVVPQLANFPGTSEKGRRGRPACPPSRE